LSVQLKATLLVDTVVVAKFVGAVGGATIVSVTSSFCVSSVVPVSTVSPYVLVALAMIVYGLYPPFVVATEEEDIIYERSMLVYHVYPFTAVVAVVVTLFPFE